MSNPSHPITALPVRTVDPVGDGASARPGRRPLDQVPDESILPLIDRVPPESEGTGEALPRGPSDAAAEVSITEAIRALERLVGMRVASGGEPALGGSLASLAGRRGGRSRDDARSDERQVERLHAALERTWCGSREPADRTCLADRPRGEIDSVRASALVTECLAGVAAAALGRLDASARELLVARHGLNGDEPMMLREIGAPAGRHKETIRQAAERALRPFKRDVRATLAGPAGRLARLVLWAALTDRDMHAWTSDLDDAGRHDRLPASLRGVLLGTGGVKALVGSSDVVVDGSLARWRCRALDDVAAAAGRAGPPPPEPVPLDAPCPSWWNTAQRSLYVCARGADTYLDYLVDPARDNAAVRRAIRTDLLLRSGTVDFVHVAELAERHEDRFGTVACDLGGYSASLARLPTLFVQGRLHEWGSTHAALPVRAGTQEALQDLGALVRPRSPAGERLAPIPEVSAPVASERLRQSVARAGVMTRGEACAALANVPAPSVGRLTAGEPRLLWFAPGLLARRDDVPRLTAAPPAALFGTGQAKALADAARSGERADDPAPLYPAWTPVPWAALERWARTHAPAHEDGELPAAELATRPDAISTEHLAAIAIEAAGRATIGRVRISRLCRARADAGTAQWVLVLLGALGVVELADHWASPHRVRPEAMRELRDALLALRRARGALGWKDPEHRGVLGRIRDGRSGDTGGDGPAWADRPAARRFLAEVLPTRRVVPGARAARRRVHGPGPDRGCRDASGTRD